MARAGQRVVARRRMQQRIDTIADGIQSCHGSRASAIVRQPRRNAPFIVGLPCQSEIKRTLRRAGLWPKTPLRRDFRLSRRIHSMQMVNDRFPGRSRYGFERVDARHAPITRAKPASIENLHRIHSIGFSANFRRFNLNANTCALSTAVSQGLIAESIATEPKKRLPGSRDVFSASHGILARAGARAAAQGEDT